MGTKTRIEAYRAAIEKAVKKTDGGHTGVHVKAHVRRKAHPRASNNKFISSAIKRPGALTAAVGGKPSQNLGAVRSLASSGSPLQRRQANFYLKVLAKHGRHKLH